MTNLPVPWPPPNAAHQNLKSVTAQDALAHVHSGQRVFVHGAAATPQVLLQALVERAAELRGRRDRAHARRRASAARRARTWPGHLRHRALFVGSNVREAVNEGRADFVPIFLSDIPALFTSGQLPLDVALIHVSPPDAHGYCSLGTSVDAAIAAAVQSAQLVIAQVNPRMPRTLGNSFIRLIRSTWPSRSTCRCSRAMSIRRRRREQRIGDYVAGLVEDGATLQLGIGGIPNAALAAMTDGTRPGRAHRNVF